MADNSRSGQLRTLTADRLRPLSKAIVKAYADLAPRLAKLEKGLRRALAERDAELAEALVPTWKPLEQESVVPLALRIDEVLADISALDQDPATRDYDDGRAELVEPLRGVRKALESSRRQIAPLVEKCRNLEAVPAEDDPEVRKRVEKLVLALRGLADKLRDDAASLCGDLEKLRDEAADAVREGSLRTLIQHAAAAAKLDKSVRRALGLQHLQIAADLKAGLELAGAYPATEAFYVRESRAIGEILAKALVDLGRASALSAEIDALESKRSHMPAVLAKALSLADDEAKKLVQMLEKDPARLSKSLEAMAGDGRLAMPVKKARDTLAAALGKLVG